MKKLGFAIIGCGLIADTHISALLDIPEASVLGAWDLNGECGEGFCKKHGIMQYSSLEDLLNDGRVDAVCICTPSVCHKEQAIIALGAGKHVVLEKPMALSAADAKEICDFAEQKGLLLTVISQYLFSDDVVRVKRLIEENAFGKLCFCDLYMKYYRAPSYYSESDWRGRLKYDGGGALMNQGIHGINLMQYLVGDGRLLSSRVKTVVHDIEVEDTAIALMEYDCGALGVVEASTCSAPGFRRRIEINGERGYAIISDSDLEKLYLDGKMIVDKHMEPHPDTASTPSLSTHELHRRQIRNLVLAAMGEEDLRITPGDGYYAVNLIESVYRLSREYDG